VFFMKYSYDIYEFIGNIGVIILIGTYFLHTMDKIKNPINYSILNIISAIFLLINLTVHVNLSAIIIEIFWILISLIGIIKNFANNKKPAKKTKKKFNK
jgi:hypothetical protein